MIGFFYIVNFFKYMLSSNLKKISKQEDTGEEDSCGNLSNGDVRGNGMHEKRRSP